MIPSWSQVKQNKNTAHPRAMNVNNASLRDYETPAEKSSLQGPTQTYNKRYLEQFRYCVEFNKKGFPVTATRHTNTPSLFEAECARQQSPNLEWIIRRTTRWDGDQDVAYLVRKGRAVALCGTRCSLANYYSFVFQHVPAGKLQTPHTKHEQQSEPVNFPRQNIRLPFDSPQ